MLGVLLALVLILIHGFFVAAEFGIVAVERTRVEERAEEGDKRARSLLRALKTLSFQLSGAQLGITITSLLVGFLIEPSLAPVLEPVVEATGLPSESTFGVSVGVALVLATSFEMVVAELVPKNLAISRPEAVAFVIATPMRVTNTAMKPLIVFLNSAANATVRVFGIQPRDELASAHSLEELQVLIRSSREGGALAEEEARLLVRAISFGDKLAADALVPRVDVVSIAVSATLGELVAAAVDTGHSRFPVCGDQGIDDIVGTAHVKDVHAIDKGRRGSVSVQEIMRPPLVVPESRDLASLLIEMRRTRLHLAVVIDEFGGTAGIVTLEDLLEEIVGEIDDEYDQSTDAYLTSSPEGVHVVGGRLHPDEVRDATGFEMPDGEYETLAGFLLSLFDRIPAAGDHISFDGWEFKIVEMEQRRIAQVLMVRAQPPAPESSDE